MNAQKWAGVNTLWPTFLARKARRNRVEMKNRLFAGKMTKSNCGSIFAIPNFCFHLTTMHDILRQNGVRIGKSDYIGDLSQFGE
jgi:hypothetical protein